ncbi:MAG: zinc metallopeptidase [Bacteroidales bacterium]
MTGYWIIFGAFMLLSMIIGGVLKSKFANYSKIGLGFNNLIGKEVAEKMLREHGVTGVQVVSVPGRLSDHYNPLNRTVNLSPDVYNGRSIAAAAVAAHECGHAIQHATKYAWLNFRSALVPVQNISAKVLNAIFIGMFLGVFAVKGLFSLDTALMVIIAAYAVFTLIAFVTLPVEINASRRALAWLEGSGVTTERTHDKAKDALRWAAYTYVVAALSSLASLLYFVAMLAGRRS